MGTSLPVAEESQRLKVVCKLLLQMFNVAVLIRERIQDDGCCGGNVKV